MEKFDIYDSMMRWYKTGTNIPDEHKDRVDKLVKEMLFDATKKYLSENISIEPDKMYWDDIWEKYVEPEDIIEAAAFEMWDENWYPKKSQELQSLVEGSEIEDFIEDLKPLCEYHIINIKRKLF